MAFSYPNDWLYGTVSTWAQTLMEREKVWYSHSALVWSEVVTFEYREPITDKTTIYDQRAMFVAENNLDESEVYLLEDVTEVYNTDIFWFKVKNDRLLIEEIIENTDPENHVTFNELFRVFAVLPRTRDVCTEYVARHLGLPIDDKFPTTSSLLRCVLQYLPVTQVWHIENDD